MKITINVLKLHWQHIEKCIKMHFNMIPVRVDVANRVTNWDFLLRYDLHLNFYFVKSSVLMGWLESIRVYWASKFAILTWAAQMLSKSSKDKAFSFITNRKIFSSFSTYCKANKNTVNQENKWLNAKCTLYYKVNFALIIKITNNHTSNKIILHCISTSYA